MPRSHIQAEGRSRADTCNRHRDNHPEYGGAERIDPRLHDFEFGKVVFHDTVDLRLISLAVGAVSLVITLLVGRLGPDFLTETDRLQAEGPKLLGSADKLVETRFLLGRHQRGPSRDQLFHGVEIFCHAVSKGGGRSHIGGRIDTARVHDDCRHQSVERLSLISPFGGFLEMMRTNPEFVDRIDGQPANGTGNKAHQPDK